MQTVEVDSVSKKGFPCSFSFDELSSYRNPIQSAIKLIKRNPFLCPEMESRKTDSERVCPESGPDSYDRRGFIRKTAVLAAAGVGGSLIGAELLPKAAAKTANCTCCPCYCYFPVTTNAQCGADGNTCGSLAIWNGCSNINSTPPGSGATISGSSPCQILSVKNTGTGSALSASAAAGISVQGVAGSHSSVPLVAKGAAGQTANLQEWQSSCGKNLGFITHNGSVGLGVTSPATKLCVSGKMHASCGLGLGTTNIKTTLALHGSLSMKARTVSTCTTMTTSDFAILANASTKAVIVTLPPANTPGACNGMIVFVKKIDSSANAVDVTAAGSDTIENVSSAPLTSQYASLTLLSNGSNEWFKISTESTS
jgi:hypothetical protein